MANDDGKITEISMIARYASHLILQGKIDGPCTSTVEEESYSKVSVPKLSRKWACEGFDAHGIRAELDDFSQKIYAIPQQIAVIEIRGLFVSELGMVSGV